MAAEDGPSDAEEEKEAKRYRSASPNRRGDAELHEDAIFDWFSEHHITHLIRAKPVVESRDFL